MTIFKCKMCGGTVEFEPGATVGVCDSCGTKQTLPRLDDDRRANLYDRAGHFRRNNEFDKAEGIYEQILSEDTSDAEAYWSLVLCRYGIEYVEDPATRKRIPTVNRTQFTSVYDDANYRSAVRYADSSQRAIYEEEAAEINRIQKGILEISQKEEPFDVFICYKETDRNGRRTPDSVLANDLYHQLTQEGFKVFFARITLEDKLGTAYEPYIFAAINSAKVMVVIGTKPEYFNAVWVKNEWYRYLQRVRESGGKKVLIPAYRDMDPYDLPEEFAHLQAQDMSKLGFMQDLIRGIRKITEAEEAKPVRREAAAPAMGGSNTEALLRRAFMFLEDGEWKDAEEYCERVLDQEPENAQAYLGKLMAELKVARKEELGNCGEPFEWRNNYQKLMRFGDKKLVSELKGYIEQINERKEEERLSGIYDDAVRAMERAKDEETCKAAAAKFKTIPGFKNSDELAERCLECAEKCRNAANVKARVDTLNNSVQQNRKRIISRVLLLLFSGFLLIIPITGALVWMLLCPLVWPVVCVVRYIWSNCVLEKEIENSATPLYIVRMNDNTDSVASRGKKDIKEKAGAVWKAYKTLSSETRLKLWVLMFFGLFTFLFHLFLDRMGIFGALTGFFGGDSGRYVAIPALVIAVIAYIIVCVLAIVKKKSLLAQVSFGLLASYSFYINYIHFYSGQPFYMVIIAVSCLFYIINCIIHFTKSQVSLKQEIELAKKSLPQEIV